MKKEKDDIPEKEVEKRLERVRKTLYRRDKEGGKKKRKRKKLHKEEYGGLPQDWDRDEDILVRASRIDMLGSSFFKKMLTISIVFFVLSIAAAAYVLFSGGNEVSMRNVQLSLVGPVEVPGGQEVLVQLVVENNNPVPLHSTDLLIEFPEGARQAGNTLGAENYASRYLGGINAGDRINEPLRFMVFGEEGEQKTIRATLEYRVDESNAIFVKEAEYKVTINQSPLIITPLMVEEVNANQNIEMQLEITSNAPDTLKDIIIEAQYPFGFEFQEAFPLPTKGDTIWSIGDLPPRGVKIITIRGKIIGAQGDGKTFRFSGGTENANKPNTIGIGYGVTSRTIAIKKPFLDVALVINGNEEVEEEVIIDSKGSIRADIIYTNNLPSTLYNVVIEARLTGEALDHESVGVNGGFYRSTDNTIIWNKNTYDELASVASGDRHFVGFLFRSLPLYEFGGSAFTNPEFTVTIDVKANRIPETNVPEVIDSTATRMIKVNSDLQMTSRGLHFTGPFSNFGEMPSRVGKETSYTIVWTVTNPSNDVDNAVIVATLPPYVRWTGLHVPINENVIHNPVTDEVTWKLGSIRAGTGVTRSAREMSFQLAILPSASQIGSSPKLIDPPVLTGYDTFTGQELEATALSVSTRIQNDPGFLSGHGQVTP